MKLKNKFKKMFEDFLLKQEREKLTNPEYYNKPVLLVRKNGSSISFKNIDEASLCTNISKDKIFRSCMDKKSLFIDKIECTFKFT